MHKGVSANFQSDADKFKHEHPNGRRRRFGDVIASNPVVHLIGKAAGCVDSETNQLKANSPCGKMRARLNAGMTLSEAVKLRLKGQ